MNQSEWKKQYRKTKKGLISRIYDSNGKGELLAEFPTIEDAAIFMGVSFQTISRYCLKQRSPANGYIWNYKENKCQ